jgi:hypothetical protein
MENSKEVSKEKKVRVEPGRMTMANFMPQREEQRTQEFRRAEYGSEEKRGDRSEREQLKLQDAGTPNRTEREDSRQNDRFRKKQSAQPSDSERQERAETQHPISGKIVRVEDDQLIISLDTGEQQTVRVPTDTRILLDGQKSDLGALKAGMHVAITTKAGNADVAAELEVKKTRSTSERQNPTDR